VKVGGEGCYGGVHETVGHENTGSGHPCSRGICSTSISKNNTNHVSSAFMALWTDSTSIWTWVRFLFQTVFLCTSGFGITGVASPSSWVDSSDPRSLVGSADIVKSGCNHCTVINPTGGHRKFCTTPALLHNRTISVLARLPTTMRASPRRPTPATRRAHDIRPSPAFTSHRGLVYK
jgi:hypothetical protein